MTLAAGTGMRQGEVLGLTRDRLRLLGKTDFGPLKTEASYRTIPLPRFVIKALNEHSAEFDVEDGELVFK
ncbi:hypothetical protein JF531_01755 [Microbacterium esteraromaticum]|uniref:hypothetical protein n=1 Tax=Microbacterium esteraromaticum TaxID=57043 RepID=UPI001A8FECA4|nr:hypothetical protein [Microbacterium esteraromaticum]MBN8423242.1 hypothetical protein [Microbacterium esteraromaticum]